jgi:hypothetical protein
MAKNKQKEQKELADMHGLQRQSVQWTAGDDDDDDDDDDTSSNDSKQIGRQARQIWHDIK